MKSKLLFKGDYRRCRNPFCHKKFIPERKDQRFCPNKYCKAEFFQIDYALRVLAQHFEFSQPMRRRKQGQPTPDQQESGSKHPRQPLLR
jgi:hypothetical protein